MSHNHPSVTHAIRLHRRINIAASVLIAVFGIWAMAIYFQGRAAMVNASQTFDQVNVRIEEAKAALSEMKAVCEQSLQARIIEAEIKSQELE
jgi:hypothetical protein